MKGDSHLVTRALECNIMADKGCTLPLPVTHFNDEIIRAREFNWARLKQDIISQARHRCRTPTPPLPPSFSPQPLPPCHRWP